MTLLPMLAILVTVALIMFIGIMVGASLTLGSGKADPPKPDASAWVDKGTLH